MIQHFHQTLTSFTADRHLYVTILFACQRIICLPNQLPAPEEDQLLFTIRPFWHQFPKVMLTVKGKWKEKMKLYFWPTSYWIPKYNFKLCFTGYLFPEEVDLRQKQACSELVGKPIHLQPHLMLQIPSQGQESIPLW